MVWPGPLSLQRTSITWQAGLRLVFSLGLFVILLGLSTAYFYHNAQDKAARERMADLTSYYASRIAQLDHDWELQSRDFRVRTEYTRILEDENTEQAIIKLQAFMTIQGSERRFQHLLIQRRDGGHVFSFGKDLTLRTIPIPPGSTKGFYLDPHFKTLYQVYEEQIWLGQKHGMGRAAYFFRIDNGLLQSLTSPDVTLTLLHAGSPIASSRGKTGIDFFSSHRGDHGTDIQTMPWPDQARDQVQLAIQAPIKTFFTTAELATSASMVPVIDGLILWFTLGLWLMRQSRRIDALGQAIKTFSTERALSPRLLTSLDTASRGPRDEIHEVAHAIHVNFEQTLEREAERDREAADRALWSSVFHSSGDAIIITDPDHCIVSVNQAFEEKMGYDLAEVIGQNPRILTDRREHPDFYRQMHEQLQRTGFWQGEMWNRHKDGSEHPKLLSISAVRNEGGEVINYVGYYTDISARKAAEAELARYQKQLESLVQARTSELEAANDALQRQTARLASSEASLKRAQAVAHIGSWTLDVQANDLRWSDETYRLFGLEPGMALSYESFIAAVHPEDRADVDASWKAALAGAAYDIEHRIVVDGQTKWVREQAELEFDAAGTLRGGVGTVQDITERKRQAAEIQSLSALQRAILDNAGVSIISTDTAGVITSFNRAAERMLGYAASEVVGVQTPALIHDPQEVAERAMQLSSELGTEIAPGFEVFVARSQRGLQNDHEWTYVRKDGSRLPVLLSVTSLRDRTGEITGFLGVATDISEAKHAEAALRQAKEEAEAANRAKSIFLANMSHELRTPLNAILGFSQLLGHTPQLDATHRAQIGFINRSGEHLLGLINDILDVSKIEVGKDTVQARDFDLHDLLEGMMAMFRMRAQAKGLYCTLSVDEAVPRHIHADERKLRQILINLLGNAVKFTRSGGVTLQARIEASARDITPARLILSVADTGLGIPEAEHERIFEPFQQGQQGVTLGEGTGLGLSICRRLAHLMGGDLLLESRIGQGSTFHVEIPCVTASAQGQAIPSKRLVIGLAPGTVAPRLLVVEDQAMNRLWLRTLLETVGFVVDEAENGQQAVSSWQQHRHALILMDLRMPVMDGLEATQRIKALPDGAATRIIAVTASAFAQDREQLMAAGCDDFLGKPIHEQELFDCLARHLDIAYVLNAHDDLPQAAGGAIAPAPLTAVSRDHLPPAVRIELRQALIEGNLQRLGRALDAVASHDPSLAVWLRRLCDGYAYQTILDWLGAGDDHDIPRTDAPTAA